MIEINSSDIYEDRVVIRGNVVYGLDMIANISDYDGQRLSILDLEDIYSNIEVEHAHCRIYYGESGAIAISELEDSSIMNVRHVNKLFSDGEKVVSVDVIAPDKNTLVLMDEDYDDDPDTAYVYLVRAVL